MKTNSIDNKFTNSALIVRPGLSQEEALVNASELLESALATANEQAFSSSGSQSLQLFGLAQLIQSAGLLVNAALEESSPVLRT
ncbi:DUF6124 family protein [Pseudomonas sp. L1(2025)]|uniref:DUF6124 family protein n=1 Tax=Pseudomonas sp. L1(2025) TaxID=3449429 RepID=UPI003F6945A6